MRYLITGGCGFFGSNLALEVIKRKEELIVLDNLSRYGSEYNLKWLKSFEDINFIKGDLRDRNLIEQLVRDAKPDIIFHLAGQVAMTVSIESPHDDFDTNALGSFNLLNSVRRYSPESIILYSSTNKVYGDLEWIEYEEKSTRYVTKDFPQGFTEFLPLSFQSPYGCSKGCADQYMLDFYKIYGIKTVVFRHSSIYGGRQYATYDQGWIGWFCKKAIDIKNNLQKEPITISGNGKQVRDILYVDDAVKLYFETIDKIECAKGHAFNIGGGIENSLSLIELFSFLEQDMGINISFKKHPPRISDQKVFISNNRKAEKFLGWKPFVAKDDGLRKIINWIDGG